MPMDEKGGDSFASKAAHGITDVASSAVLNQLIRPIKLPWERSPVLNPTKSLFSFWPDLNQSTVGMRDFANNAGCETDEPVPTQTQCLGHTLKRAKLASCVVSPDDMRLRSLSLIKIMLEADKTSTKLAQAADGDKSGPGALSKSIRDVLTGKSTATIYKRTQSMFALFTWIRAHDGGTGLDLTERRLYTYLCSMRDSGRGATSGEAVLQAVRFFHSMFEFNMFDIAACLSPRVIGVAKDMFLHKRLLQQARALFAPEIRALEDAVLEERQPHIVVIAGYLLFCLLSVCRFSDAMFVTGMTVSRHGNTVLIEAGTAVHKTAQTKERKTMLLPLMALGHALRLDKSWGERWIHVMSRQFADSRKLYVLPAYSEQSNRWLTRPMTTGEGVLWLRGIVGLRCRTGDSLTTHSLKTTLLSWVTLFGLMSFDQRRVLGHHIDAGLASPLTYGRDNVAPLQVILAKLLRQVAQGELDPDAPRVQRIDKELEIRETLDDLEADQEGAVFGVQAQPHDDVDEMDDAYEADEMVDKAFGGQRVYIAASRADGRLKQHQVSGVLHFIGLDDKFVCGRGINGFYEDVADDLAHDWPMCQQCRKAMGEEAVSTYLES